MHIPHPHWILFAPLADVVRPIHDQYRQVPQICFSGCGSWRLSNFYPIFCGYDFECSATRNGGNAHLR
jgi:hypothetical protein